MNRPATRQRTSRPRRSAAAVAAAVAALTGCSTADAARDDDTVSDLFDDSVVHDIDVALDQAEYDAMIESFEQTGAKEWISATVTVDGETLEDVGLRLKGNSSLAGLGGQMSGRRDDGPAVEDRDGEPPTGDVPAVVAGPSGSASAEEPESLPWLVRLDKYVDGQTLDGLSSFVIRSNGSQTALNEAVALELVGLAGLATQEAAASRLSVNGSAERLRLVVENPDDEWEAENFPNDGVLYKAEAGGDYSYRGDDPESYVDVFDQETDTDREDLTPLIDFLDFLNNSDDDTFASELDEHLDTDAFARYLAVQDLIGNFDDIDGPGNNSYLRYDAETGRFTVVTWDLNLAFGGGGDGGPAGVVMRDGPRATDATRLPENVEPPEGFGPPEGFAAPDGTELGIRGPGGESNILVERFTGDEEFNAAYEAAKDELTRELYTSGAATEILERWTAVLEEHAGDLVDATTIEEEASTIAEHFDPDTASPSPTPTSD